MSRQLDIIGAPSSAGAYTPGQEQAPQALREAGLVAALQSRRIEVRDRGDVPGFRWRVDLQHPRAMNADEVATVATAVAGLVAQSLDDGSAVLVLGGDCTVGIGTVAGAVAGPANVGLLYVDLDTDLNTPQTTTDGALDWMGVAHLLDLPGTVPAVTKVGHRTPLLLPDQVLLFGADNVTPAERAVIDAQAIREVRLADVAADPAGAARAVAREWARRFDRVLVHVDVDVLDYLDLPIAEETRRNRGLRFAQLVAALRELVAAPNWVGLTVCEVNPDHGESDGSTLRILNEGLADAISAAFTPSSHQ
jgi:arginase